jgi:hypothetical protein
MILRWDKSHARQLKRPVSVPVTWQRLSSRRFPQMTAQSYAEKAL